MPLLKKLSNATHEFVTRFLKTRQIIRNSAFSLKMRMATSDQTINCMYYIVVFKS